MTGCGPLLTLCGIAPDVGFCTQTGHGGGRRILIRSMIKASGRLEPKLNKLSEPKATETRTCKTLPDGQPSSPEQHQASD
jgi:hypothetical protein